MSASHANTWPFADPPNVAAFSTRRVISGERPILFVYRDSEDGAWQFHAKGESSTEEAITIGLNEIVRIDPTVIELADLPIGWMASRAKVSAAWRRQPQ